LNVDKERNRDKERNKTEIRDMQRNRDKDSDRFREIERLDRDEDRERKGMLHLALWYQRGLVPRFPLCGNEENIWQFRT
jgi:hypothetical protein